MMADESSFLKQRADVDSIPIEDADPHIARTALLYAARELALRGLDHSAAWALDLVHCLPYNPPANRSDDNGGDSRYEDTNGGGEPSGHSRHNTSSAAAVASPWLPSSLKTNPALAASTPARSMPHRQKATPATSASYPMQSTPFLGIVAPSSSSVLSSSPQRPPPQQASPSERQANLTIDQVHHTPAPSDMSASGRFPPPFRQPPSPLANLSYSAEGEDAAAPASSNRPQESVRQRQNRLSAQDDSIQEDQEELLSNGGGDGAHSAHVRFASEGITSRSQSHFGDDLAGLSEPEDSEAAAYELALSCFRTGQLHRCAWVLKKSLTRLRRSATRSESPRSAFLRLYCEMLLCEGSARKDIEEHNPFDLAKSVPNTLREFVALLKDLVDPQDPFLLFLKGIILRKLKKRLEAMDCIIRSLLSFPYNWTAWLELNALIDPASGELEHILPLLPKSFMLLFWREHSDRQMAAGKDPEANVERIATLLDIFPDNAGLWNALGSTRYMQQDFLPAVEAFERALEIDPYRPDGLADYSNALFLLERSDKLSELAHSVSIWGSSHAEASCVIGNHFYYQADHVRAIEAFKKAIKLDPGCVAAWILLGHAFIEMKNAGAASEMYRRAIDVHPRDYRPWHGLGKVYELLEGWSFAVHYYLKAAAIAPYTATVWSSLGHVYTRLGRYRNAISSYQRHLACESGRNIAGGGMIGGGDVGTQLGSISAILALLDKCIADADAELDQAGADGNDQGGATSAVQHDDKTLAQLTLHRSSLVQESIDWHRRSVALLLSTTNSGAATAAADPEAGITADGNVGDDEDDPQRARESQPLLSTADFEPWAESFVKAARSVAGLPADFDPSTEDPASVANEEEFALGNTGLACEYLSKLLAATGHLAAAQEEEVATGGIVATSVVRWRYEAEQLLKWLHAVKAL